MQIFFDIQLKSRELINWNVANFQIGFTLLYL